MTEPLKFDAPQFDYIDGVDASLRCYLHYAMPFVLAFSGLGLIGTLLASNFSGFAAFAVAAVLAALHIAVDSIKDHIDATTFECEVYEEPCCCGHPGFGDVEDE